MQRIISEINVLFPQNWDPVRFLHLGALEPFNPDVLEFLNELSRTINKDPLAQAFPDLITFSFFCRKAHLIRLREEFVSDNKIRLGRGLVFHITPSNVPINFAYSLVCGLLSGNGNIVRVPSQSFDQVEFICRAISELGRNRAFSQIKDRIALVQYERSSEATEFFSSICDVRVIWGGDETIQTIRKYPLPARAFDVTFADRYSLCIINADQFIAESHPEQVAAGFYNDTYLFDQNACTSPHLVVWTGVDDNVRKSKEIFWENLHHVVVRKKYELQPIMAVDKLTALYSQAFGSTAIRKVDSEDNLIWRAELDRLPVNLDEFRCSGGYFSEYHAASLSEIAPIINRKYQTLAYYGYSRSELENFIREQKPSGIDRIVPIGKTSDFSFIWDGYDLIRALSRIIEIN